MTKEELKEYLVTEAEYSKETVEGFSDYELVNKWLCWNGMIGWTRDILEVVEAAFGIKINY